MLTFRRRKSILLPILVLFICCFSNPADCQNAIVLVGSGGSAGAPLYSHWNDEYNKLSVKVQVHYVTTGTVQAIEDTSRGRGDFGAGDVFMTDKQLKAADTPILEVPAALVAIVPVYNLPSVKSGLHFSGPVLADIFLGSIKYWDDPRIKQLNAGQDLPHLSISVVHRTEGKGSTYIFTDFLSSSSKKWLGQIGRTPSPKWPLGESANRSQDIADKVKSTAGSIGYVEHGYTQNDSNISVGMVENAGGKFVSANGSSIAAAYHALERSIPPDFRASLANAPGNEAYPIVSFTWIYVPIKSDPERSKALVSYFEWAFSTGQQSSGKMGFTALPESLTLKVLAKIRTLSSR